MLSPARSRSYVYPVNATRPAPGSQASLREANRQRVLDAVREHGPLTQVEIAAATGLSAATVSNMVKELDQAGMVALSPSIRNGRRAVLVSARLRRSACSPASPSVTATSASRIATGRSEILAQQRMPLQADHVADEGMERAARLLARPRRHQSGSVEDIGAIGVGLPAPVDSCRGQVGSEAVLPGLARRQRRRGDGRRASAHRSLLDNTANLAALGELNSARCMASARLLHQVLLRRGRRARARRRALPRLRRYGGRDRAPHHRRERADLPVRQPRLPRHLRRVAGVLAPCAARTARSTLRDIVHRALEGDLGLPPGDRGLPVATSASPSPVWSTCSTPR